MSSIRTIALVTLTCFAAGACSSGPTQPEEEDEIPYFGGSWNLMLSSLVEPLAAGAPSHQGGCWSVSFQMSLELAEVEENAWTGETHHYSGSHAGFTLRCYGVGASPATEVFGMADSVIVIEPGTVTASASRRACINFWCDSGPTWKLSVSGDDFALSLGGEDNHALSGDFVWLDSSGDPKVVGAASMGLR